MHYRYYRIVAPHFVVGLETEKEIRQITMRSGGENMPLIWDYSCYRPINRIKVPWADRLKRLLMIIALLSMIMIWWYGLFAVLGDLGIL